MEEKEWTVRKRENVKERKEVRSGESVTELFLAGLTVSK